MDLPGETYLFNLSLIAITFTAVSTLVMLVRQTMGGKLSNFDVFLITTYISLGFVAAWDAVLPGLIALLHLPDAVIWVIASLIAAFLIGAAVSHIQWQRWKATALPPPAMVVVAYSAHWIAMVLLLVNAAVPGLRGAALYAIAVSVSLGMVMWRFVRRISLLIGDKPGEDWDPKRG